MENENYHIIGSIEATGDEPMPPDWEDILLDFCADERVDEFFNRRNAVREMMRQREALLKSINRIRERAERVIEGEHWWLPTEGEETEEAVEFGALSEVAAANWLIEVLDELPAHVTKTAKEKTNDPN